MKSLFFLSSLTAVTVGAGFPELAIAQNAVNPSSLSQADTSATLLVGELVIKGATPELEAEIYDVIQTRPGRTTSETQLEADANAIFSTGWFSTVDIYPENTPLGVRITFAVEPNPPFQSVAIATTAEDPSRSVVPQETLDEIFAEGVGNVLNTNQFRKQIQALEQWYQDNGYILARIQEIQRPTPDGQITLTVNEGMIGKIEVRFMDEDGEEVDGRTKDYIITRELSFQEGEVFNQNDAQRDFQRIFNLGLFEDIRYGFAEGENNQSTLVLDMLEGQTGSVAAGAGVSSASGLFGTVSYQQQNFRGRNQKIATELQLGTKELLFDISYTDPWIAGDPYRTSYRMNAFRSRSLSLIFDGGDPDIGLAGSNDTPRLVRTGGGVNFNRPYPADPFSRGDWNISTGFQYQRVEVNDDNGDRAFVDSLGNRLSFSDSGADDMFTFSLGATNDQRNDALQPTAGSLLRLGIDQTVPLGSGNILMNRLRGSYSFYVPVDYLGKGEKPEAFAFNFQGGTILGDLPPYEAFSLGGSNSVRGYQEGEVGSGRSYVQATAEYRFPFVSVLSGALFMDYASDLGTADDVPGNPAGVRGKPGDGFGYGAGVRIQSPLGPIRLDYGIADDGNSRIHFGIGERF